MSKISGNKSTKISSGTGVWILICLIQIKYACETLIERPQNRVVLIGGEFVLRCRCNVTNSNRTYNWMHHFPDRDINYKSALYDNLSGMYQLQFKETECKYDLKILEAKFEHAGIYSCFYSKLQKFPRANVIIVDTNTTCKTDPQFSKSWEQNKVLVEDSFNINITCSFKFRAHNSCEIIPQWYDLTRNKKLTESDDDVKFGVGREILWFSFNGSAQIKNGTKFNLSAAFKCRTGYGNKDANHYADNDPVFVTGIAPQVIYTKSNFKISSTAAENPHNGIRMENLIVPFLVAIGLIFLILFIVVGILINYFRRISYITKRNSHCEIANHSNLSESDRTPAYELPHRRSFSYQPLHASNTVYQQSDPKKPTNNDELDIDHYDLIDEEKMSTKDEDSNC